MTDVSVACGRRVSFGLVTGRAVVDLHENRTEFFRVSPPWGQFMDAFYKLSSGLLTGGISSSGGNARQGANLLRVFTTPHRALVKDAKRSRLSGLSRTNDGHFLVPYLDEGRQTRHRL